MNRLLSLLACVFSLLFVSASLAEVGAVDFPRYPSISPDGSQIVFTFRGDLWRASAKGGMAQRITTHPQDELFSAWSPDGQRIAFTSSRSGSTNIHTMSPDGTDIQQLTYLDRPFAMVGYGRDEAGNVGITIAARLEADAFGGARAYFVALTGGEPVRIHDAFGTFPVISPDGSKVLFNRGNASWSRRGYRGSDTRDVWLYDRKAKTFTQLTKWQGNDGRARWIDNESFVYSSDRNDNTTNLYRLKLGEAEDKAQRLTNFKNIDVEDFDISADGKTLVFAAWDKLYTLNLADRNAVPVALALRGDEEEADRYEWRDISRNVSEAALSPDGKTMAVVAFGDVYVRSTDARSPTRRVTTMPGRERDLAWAPDNSKLYFVSNETGVEAIYVATVKQTRTEIRKAFETTTGIPLVPTAPAASAPATAPATTSPESHDSPDAAPTRPTRRPATQPQGQTESQRWSDAMLFNTEIFSQSDEGDASPSPSPDGKKLAFRRGNGNLMLMTLSDKSTKLAVKGWSPALEVRWSGDSKWIAYTTSDENYNSDIWVVRSDLSAPPVNVTQHPRNDYSPRWSADNRVLAFVSERGGRGEMDVYAVWLDKDMEALPALELDAYYRDAVAAARRKRPLGATGPAPSTTPADGESRATTPAATTGTARPPKDQLDLDDAYLRVRRITSLPGNESNLELSPGGETFYFVGGTGSSRGTYSVDRDGGEPRRIASAVSVQHLSLTGDMIVFVEGGRAGTIRTSGGGGTSSAASTPAPAADPSPGPGRFGGGGGAAGGAPASGAGLEYVDISDRIRLDKREFNRRKFLEAARVVGTNYYDAKMGGTDWNALTQRYLDLASKTRTSDEFNHVAARLLGELNGSHLGINSPDGPNPQSRPSGRLGTVHERVDKGFKVTRIFPQVPLAKGPMRLMVDDIIVAIDGEPIGPTDTIEAMLRGKTDREVMITVIRKINGTDKEVTLLLQPIVAERMNSIVYEDWRSETARKVAELSNGQIGYIHIQSMSDGPLETYERDLYAAMQGKKGLIIDVRNNGGGSTADKLLASIMYPRHATTVARGMDPAPVDGYPHDRLYIQRASMPMNLLCNERSFSNAEIFAHAFKTLKRGTLVGVPTAGGVISTGGTSLLDGTTVRIPFRGWWTLDGVNMENNGAVPDLIVPQTPEDEAAGRDRQLEEAVKDLMKRLK